MFGRMRVDAIFSVKPGCEPLAAVRALVERAEGVKVMKWIEFPDSILVFLMVRADVTSGATMSWTANQGYGTGLTSRTIITGIQPKGNGAVVERRQLAELDRTTGAAAEWAEVGRGMWAGSGSHIELRIDERNCNVSRGDDMATK